MDKQDETSRQSASDHDGDGEDETHHSLAKHSSNPLEKKNATAKNQTVGNELTHLIPGYTAPMRLETKSLRGIADVSVTELRKRAEASDAAKYNKQISILSKPTSTSDTSYATKIKTPSSLAIQRTTGSKAFNIPTSFTPTFHNKPQKQNDNTAGAKWFGMTPTPMTDSLKTDLALIRNRNYLDPKKFYKSADSFAGKVLQVGTVIEGPSEYYSSRLVKRERRQNFTEEVMADQGVASYAKRKFGELQMEKEKRRGGGGGGKKGRVVGKKRR
ncbi:hypothetical protein HJC23_008801 [Cyclotella cryptica]|uniref:Fcf2 pre-rRNA processing C-terminal domain-containing protein n=1 Tax=Cyclotella cryptica TaxID=29204 RepID=A0ABD3PRB0_9STRA|eukprot:CCRYP_012210-RA/>CCRYP_012210-RA protein AED:0.20 eAED:0.20 QI:0/-1/0/1/-1/1/1/0/271